MFFQKIIFFLHSEIILLFIHLNFLESCHMLDVHTFEYWMYMVDSVIECAIRHYMSHAY
jgi:hypothetical protein